MVMKVLHQAPKALVHPHHSYFTIVESSHVSSSFTFHFANERWVSFWNDMWIGDQTLSSTFPSLYFITKNRTSSLADFLSLENCEQNFRSPMSYAARNEYHALVSTLSPVQLSIGLAVGTKKWNLNRIFTFKCCYYFLMHGAIVSHFGRVIWN